MHMDDLYAIGDVARRTGLAVSAIRYYADAGVVTPAAVTPGGARMYDVAAIARLELVRTLRDFDAGLDEIKRVLAGKATLRELAATHLELLEQQEAKLRTRRAVLSAILRQDSTADQVTLMHKLAGMSDEERDRLIDEFWTEVCTGWEPPPKMEQWWRQARPVLPDDPTAAQLEAWIELARLVSDPQVRSALRDDLRETCTTGAGPFMSSEPMLEFMESGGPIGQATIDAARERVPADSPLGREIADRWMAWMIGMFGMADTTEFRIGMADHMLAGAEWDREPTPGEFGRYQELVHAVNGVEPEVFPYEWLADAIRATADAAA
ncbi:MerR family transcriptional regulator [Actinoplanes couchii]|uniref:MerR family transcriptional regulator n=1 Tax=Actinoplanes couchii TaxID=403638 RepID=A0ABQ3XNH5_9ACTN|nr:MerR family transcriptional regulator [Actinoplanes couchii]MDR6318021.1 DNA-binding transcriptional MerR regulator [Actinoplanes couchii]GID60062.1 MerR family transcriptional regulator [Actinoplanes couchii]